jgi:6-phospho-beta-glucosidase
VRLTVIGGSGSATPELFDALAAWPGGDACRPSLEVVLNGRSAERLAVVAAEARRRSARVPRLLVETASSLEAALQGADVVLVQARVGGLRARAFDETFPRAFGLPGEETMGPGGFANAVRTVPALDHVWRAIGRTAPAATTVVLTNPAGLVARAAARAGLHAVSVCDSPVTFTREVAAVLGRAVDEVRAGYVGMNHAGFWAGGAADDRRSALVAAPGIEPDDVARLGALPTPYVRYYLHPDREIAAQRAQATPRAERLRALERDLLDDWAAAGAAPSGGPPRAAPGRGAAWYGLAVVPFLDALVNPRSEPLILGLPNGGRVAWAGDDATIEAPARVEGAGRIVPMRAAALPSPAAALLARHAEYEASTMAALEHAHDRPPDRAALVRALSANPLVGSLELAGGLVDRILAASP